MSLNTAQSSYLAISSNHAEEHDARRHQDVQSREFGDSSDNRRMRHDHCGVSLVLRNRGWRYPELGTAAAGLAVSALPFNVLRLSEPRHSPIYSTVPLTTVIRPAVRCQATSRNEIKLEGVNGGPIKCIHLAHRVPHASARKAFSALDEYI